jgi:hypothetical protein
MQNLTLDTCHRCEIWHIDTCACVPCVMCQVSHVWHVPCFRFRMCDMCHVSGLRNLTHWHMRMCDLCHVSGFACVTCVMCQVCEIWHIDTGACVTCVMCQVSHVWHVSCVRFRMCDMCHVSGLRNLTVRFRKPDTWHMSPKPDTWHKSHMRMCQWLWHRCMCDLCHVSGFASTYCLVVDATGTFWLMRIRYFLARSELEILVWKTPWFARSHVRTFARSHVRTFAEFCQNFVFFSLFIEFCLNSGRILTEFSVEFRQDADFCQNSAGIQTIRTKFDDTWEAHTGKTRCFPHRFWKILSEFC